MKSVRRVAVRTHCQATSATVNKASTTTETFSSASVSAYIWTKKLQKVTHLKGMVLKLIFVCFPLDVNECHDESLCMNGQCFNTKGSFYCTCNHPWMQDSSKKKCVMTMVAGQYNYVAPNRI